MSGQESSSESEVESPQLKKQCSLKLSTNRASSRQSEKAQKQWAVFDFAADHSLMTAPGSWVKTVKIPSSKTGTTKIKTKCYWPRKGSRDESNIRRLIKAYSDPDVNWDLLEGVFKGFFKTHKEGDAYITEKLGTFSTSSCSVTDFEQEKLNILEEEAKLLMKSKSSKSKNEKYHHKPSPRTSRSSTPCVPLTQSFSNRGHSPSPSTSYSTPGGVTPGLAARRLYNNAEFKPAQSKTQGERENRSNEEDIQKILLLLQELKEDVQDLKKNGCHRNPQCCSNKAAEAYVENPFEMLRSFGFRANTVEQLSLCDG